MCLIQKVIYYSFLLLFISSSQAQETFLSLKKNKVNIRYGPSFDFPVKYVYKKINLPVKQIDKKENFRRIIDLKNNGGWVHVSQIKKNNSIIVLQDKILFKKPSIFSKPIAQIKKGRLLVIKTCDNDWCRILSDNFVGWIKTSNIWGSIN